MRFHTIPFSAVVFPWLLLLSFPLPLQGQDAAPADTTAPDSLVDAAWQIVFHTYGGADFDSQAWETLGAPFLQNAYTTTPEAHAAIEAMLIQFGDPSVRSLEATEFASLLQDLSGQDRAGLGLMELLSVDIDEQTHALTVVTSTPNTPAAMAGLRPNDVILAIDGTPTSGLALHDAMHLLRGDASEIALTIQRDTTTFNVQLTREAALPPPEAVRVLRKQEETLTVGYIGLTQFTEGTADSMESAITELLNQQVDAFVLDLRNNPGGLLPEAIAIADLWLNADLSITSTISRGDTTNTLRTTASMLTDKPLVVLVNEGSASAAEVLAGALQAHRRATIIGTATFGKGLAHTAQPLGDGSFLMLPMGRLLTPTGRDILKARIAPDVYMTQPIFPVLQPETIAPATPQDLAYVAALEALLQAQRDK